MPRVFALVCRIVMAGTAALMVRTAVDEHNQQATICTGVGDVHPICGSDGQPVGRSVDYEDDPC